MKKIDELLGKPVLAIPAVPKRMYKKQVTYFFSDAEREMHARDHDWKEVLAALRDSKVPVNGQDTRVGVLFDDEPIFVPAGTIFLDPVEVVGYGFRARQTGYKLEIFLGDAKASGSNLLALLEKETQGISCDVVYTGERQHSQIADLACDVIAALYEKTRSMDN